MLDGGFQSTFFMSKPSPFFNWEECFVTSVPGWINYLNIDGCPRQVSKVLLNINVLLNDCQPPTANRQPRRKKLYNAGFFSCGTSTFILQVEWNDGNPTSRITQVDKLHISHTSFLYLAQHTSAEDSALRPWNLFIRS